MNLDNEGMQCSQYASLKSCELWGDGMIDAGQDDRHRLCYSRKFCSL